MRRSGEKVKKVSDDVFHDVEWLTSHPDRNPLRWYASFHRLRLTLKNLQVNKTFGVNIDPDESPFEQSIRAEVDIDEFLDHIYFAINQDENDIYTLVGPPKRYVVSISSREKGSLPKYNIEDAYIGNVSQDDPLHFTLCASPEVIDKIILSLTNDPNATLEIVVSIWAFRYEVDLSLESFDDPQDMFLDGIRNVALLLHATVQNKQRISSDIHEENSMTEIQLYAALLAKALNEIKRSIYVGIVVFICTVFLAMGWSPL